MCRQHPFERHAEDAMAFAHSGGVELVADFAADEFRRGGQRVERERNGKRLLQLQRAVHAPQHHAFEPAAVERQAEHARQFLPFPKVDFQDVVHCVVLSASKVCRALSPRAQPSRLKSWR